MRLSDFTHVGAARDHFHHWSSWAIGLGAFFSIVLAASVAGAADNASFLSQSVPATVGPGQAFLVSITMKNTGTTTWFYGSTPAVGYKLGSQNPQDNITWGTNRINLNSGETVAPGASKTFQASLTAPSTPGPYNFQWRMVQPNGWFGAFTTNIAITVASNDNASFVSQSVPTTVGPGQAFLVSITMKNTGTTTWFYGSTPAVGYKLGSQNPQDNITWGTNRINLNSGETVAPGASKTFQASLTAPSTPGPYNFQWRMVQPNGWFGAFTTNVAISVTSPTSAGPLERLFNGTSRFVIDQSTVPLEAATNYPGSGHREAFAVNRTDLGAQTILMYHRCFPRGIPEICVARSDNGGTTYGASTLIITNTLGVYSVAPYVLKIGTKWTMVYEEGAPETHWAESTDGFTWTKRGKLLNNSADEQFVAGASVFKSGSTYYLFYATLPVGEPRRQLIRRRSGSSIISLGAPTTVFTASQTGGNWVTQSVHMPRIIQETQADGRTAYYMTFDAATKDFGCGEFDPNNHYGWGMARSYDYNLRNWTAYSGNPIRMATNTPCGNDMPQPLIRYDGKMFVFHTSDGPINGSYKIVRETIQ